MVVVLFIELSFEFWGNSSEFDFERVVFEVFWRFLSEDVEQYVGYIGLEFRGQIWFGLEYEFVKYLY